jgi:hypothetical protein
MPDDDIAAFRKSLKASLKRNQEAFEGLYADQLSELLGLSAEELAEVAPDTTDQKTYNDMISVVKEASRKNIAQAELKSQIESLGAVAINIAKKVQGFAGMF